MSNVVHLNVPSRTQRESDRHIALLRSFAQERRFGDDVFWLKENAELLNILECSGVNLSPEVLTTYDGFYAQIEKRLGFFPQYYRFLLSICLDLEDLGMPGGKAAALVNWACDQGLAQAEISDLQRAEARRLMLRRGCDPMAEDPGLEDRLRAFVSRPLSFAIPNKKAAYELTHTVFYLSEYGRKDPDLGAKIGQSLDFTGTLAFLDLNADLLAEVCIAMRYAGITPPEIWEGWLARHTGGFSFDEGETISVHDDYHEFFVCNWLMGLSGRDAFAMPFVPERMSFSSPYTGAAPLRGMSETLFSCDTRRDDWGTMRHQIADALSEESHDILIQAEAASQDFDGFFAGFARAGLRAPVAGSVQSGKQVGIRGQGL